MKYLRSLYMYINVSTTYEVRVHMEISIKYKYYEKGK